MTVDYSDPCAVVPLLREAYYALLAGEKAQTVTFEAVDGIKRTTTYHKADIAALAAEIRRLDGECAAKTTGRPARFAISTGGRR